MKVIDGMCGMEKDANCGDGRPKRRARVKGRRARRRKSASAFRPSSYLPIVCGQTVLDSRSQLVRWIASSTYTARRLYEVSPRQLGSRPLLSTTTATNFLSFRSVDL